MANTESFARKTEVVVEKGGGGLIALAGLASLNIPEVAVGVALYFIGKFRGRSSVSKPA